MNEYRIEDRENVHLNGEPVTGFKLFRRDGDRYLYSGQHFAPGFDCSEAICIGYYLKSALEES